jgi:Mrp family chromosome partitioning ATPase/capsular polysaccharide biosynthesis protein
MTGRQPDLDDHSGEPRSFDLRDYTQIIRRHVVLIVVLAVLGAVAAAGYALHSGHTYAATAQVLVTSATQGSASSSAAQQVATQANMSTEEAIAQSPPVVLQAAKLLHVPSSTLQAAAAKRLTVNVPATTLATSNLLQITWQAKKPAAAQAGADAFANAYLSYRRQLLASQVNSQTASLSQRLALVQQQITKLHAQLNRTPTTTPLHQTLALKLKQLVSEQTAYNSKLASLSVSSSSAGSLIPAARPGAATGLSHKLYLVLGGLVGLLIGLVLAFVVDAFDDRIRDVAQFDQKLGAPTLALLPPDVSLPELARETGNGAPRQRPSMTTTAAPESQAAEAMRTLRATLAAMGVRRQLRTLLVVAADASVSAGQLAALLGVALAESGRRVLLIAADVRGSVLPEIFDAYTNMGLSDLLISDGDPKELLRKSQQVVLPGQAAQQLTVLPPGPQPAHAMALLDSPAMERLLHGARDAYDFVLLDSPPATAAADAYALAANVDGVLVAARERRTHGRAVEELSRRLDRIGAVLVGGVLIAKGRPRRQRQRRRGAEPPHGAKLARSVPVADAEGERAHL